MDSLYRKYENILLFCGSKYRNFNFDNPPEAPNSSKHPLTKEDFVSAITKDEYVLHTGHDEAMEDIYLFIFSPDSKYLKQTAFMNKLISKLDISAKATVFLFTKVELSIYIRKMLKQYTKIKTKNYLFKHFIIEINKGPLCNEHIKLTDEQTDILCKSLRIDKMDLPKIYINDPQIIWIGAEVGQVVLIKSKSLIAGIRYHYRVVFPKKNW